MRPINPKFSSGPCAKFPGWTPNYFNTDLLGRSHRSEEGLILIHECLANQRQLLDIPNDYSIGIIVGSATAAFEAGLWNLLGVRPVTVWQNGVFSKLWAADIQNLGIKDNKVISVPYGQLPDLIDTGDDLVLTWTETSTGVHIPHGDWIEDKADRLVFCDATAAAFCEPLPWSKLDVIAFSWQKGLGAEAAHGSLVLSPRALKRLSQYKPQWAIPRLMQLKLPDGEPNSKFFEGHTLNTPSLLCIQDVNQAMEWAIAHGGGSFLYKRCQTNFKVVCNWLAHSKKYQYAVQNSDQRAASPILLKLRNDLNTNDAWKFYRHLAEQLKKEHIAYDIVNHAHSLPALRLWTGPTIEAEDLSHVCTYLEKITI